MVCFIPKQLLLACAEPGILTLSPAELAWPTPLTTPLPSLFLFFSSPGRAQVAGPAAAYLLPAELHWQGHNALGEVGTPSADDQ